MHPSIVYKFLLAVLFLSCSDEPTNIINRHYSLSFLEDKSVYNAGNHAAFTAIVNFQGEMFLAFREGKNHIPTDKNEYGKIKILQLSNGKWCHFATLSNSEMDLRDPYFLVVNNRLRLYSGYNESVNGSWQHIATVYSELSGNIWSDFKKNYS